MKKIIFICTFPLLSLISFAQNDSAVKHTSFNAGLTYSSRLNYYGRTDSLQSQGIIPFVGIEFRNGLYVNANVVFVANSMNHEYAATISEAGYRFSDAGNKWAGNVFVSKYFYRDNALVQSALKGSAGLNLSNMNRIVNVNLGVEGRLSDKVDLANSLGLDHLFSINSDGKTLLFLDPAVYAYAGTQHFSETYYQKKYFLLFPSGEQAVSKDSRRYDILAYEMSCPVIVPISKFRIIISPSYIVPQNVISVTNEVSRWGKSTFYLNATARVDL